MSASQTHNRANMRMRCEDSLAAFADIVRLTAGTTVTLNGTVATAFGCPFVGRFDEDRILAFDNRYPGYAIGAITSAVTTGMSSLRLVASLRNRVAARLRATAW